VRLTSVRKSVKIEIQFCREAFAIVDRSIDKAQCVQGLRSIDDALPNIELLVDIAQDTRDHSTDWIRRCIDFEMAHCPVCDLL